jgi:hypothetical protein
VLYRENPKADRKRLQPEDHEQGPARPHLRAGAAGLPDLKLQGRREDPVAAGDIVSMPVELSSAPDKLPSSTNEVTFILKDADDQRQQAKSRFIGPQIR